MLLRRLAGPGLASVSRDGPVLESSVVCSISYFHFPHGGVIIQGFFSSISYFHFPHGGVIIQGFFSSISYFPFPHGGDNLEGFFSIHAFRYSCLQGFKIL